MKRGRKPLPNGKRKDVMLRVMVTGDVDEWITTFTDHNNISVTELLRACLGEFMFTYNDGRELVKTDPTFNDVRKIIEARIRESYNASMS